MSGMVHIMDVRRMVKNADERRMVKCVYMRRMVKCVDVRRRLRLDRSTALYIYKAKNCKLLVLFTHAQKNKIYI